MSLTFFRTSGEMGEKELPQSPWYTVIEFRHTMCMVLPGHCYLVTLQTLKHVTFDFKFISREENDINYFNRGNLLIKK